MSETIRKQPWRYRMPDCGHHSWTPTQYGYRCNSCGDTSPVLFDKLRGVEVRRIGDSDNPTQPEAQP